MTATSTTNSNASPCCAPDCCAEPPTQSTGTTSSVSALDTMDPDAIRNAVQSVYAKIASEGGSCCGPAGCAPGDVQELAQKMGYGDEKIVAPAESNLGLGCGNPHAMAELRPGETVLDLGSGAGFDAFIASDRVGAKGRVIGVDMTPEMVERASTLAASNGIGNVEFRLGQIEALPVEDQTVDVILSNCVINLVPDKGRAFEESFRVLKPGGRIAISDIVALQMIPEPIRASVAAYAGCIAGAAPVSLIEEALESAGFTEISVNVEPGSAALVESWLPGAEAYIASARIQATRPQ